MVYPSMLQLLVLVRKAGSEAVIKVFMKLGWVEALEDQIWLTCYGPKVTKASPGPRCYTQCNISFVSVAGIGVSIRWAGLSPPVSMSL